MGNEVFELMVDLCNPIKPQEKLTNNWQELKRFAFLLSMVTKKLKL